jgi:GTPase SAR1 family protein
MKNIDENAPDDVIRVLVGNKSDLHHRLVISTQDGKRLANEYHVDFYETSAKIETSPIISNMFYSLAEKLVDLKQSAPKSSTDKINLSNQQTDSTYERVTSCCSFTTNN